MGQRFRRFAVRAAGAALFGLLLARGLRAQEPPAESVAPAPPSFTARVVQDFVLDGRLTEWTRADAAHEPIAIDDRANLYLSETSAISRSWAGPEDLSGRFYVGLTSAELLIAGEVHDDVLTLNPRTWWQGDEIEVFLDTRLDPAEPNPTEYNEDDFQLILFPPAEGRTWGFAAVGRHRGRSDGDFDGVRTAWQPLSTGGPFKGYSFEVAIPLVNFAGLDVRAGAEIGFGIALVDADGEFGQKTYMTVDGRGGLAIDPTRFGRLRFASAPPPAPAPPRPPRFSLLEPAAILGAGLLVVFLLYRFRRPLTPLAELGIRGKLLILLPVAILAAAGTLAPGAVENARRTETERGLGDRLDRLTEILAEARAEGLLGPTETGPDPETVMALLEGRPADPPERYRYRSSFAAPAPPSRTLSELPVLDYARSLAPGERADFAPADPAPAGEVAVVLRFLPDASARVPVRAGDPVAEIRAVLEQDGQVVERRIRYGTDLDSAAALAENGHAAPDSTVAWRDQRAGTHADEIRLALPDGARVLRVEVERVAEEGTVLVHGATLAGPGSVVPTPLPMVVVSAIGRPTTLWQDRPPGHDVVLAPGAGPLRLSLHPPVDRVWLFYAGRPDAGEDRRDPPGREMLSIVVEGDAGPLGPAAILRNGEHVDDEVLAGTAHPPAFEAEIGYRWLRPNDWAARHRDVVEIEIADRDAARALVLTSLAGAESILVAGFTEGRRLDRRPPGNGTHLVSEDGRYRLSEAAAAELSGLHLTWYRDGRAIRTTFDAGEGRGAVIGAALPARALPPDGRPTEPDVRTLGDRAHVGAYLPVDDERRHVLEASLPLEAATGLRRAATITTFAALALLLLGLLLVAGDLLSRVHRLRTRLTLGFAMTALVPLLLFFFGIHRLFEREAGRTEESALRESLRQVRVEFEERSAAVKDRAKELLRDEGLERTTALAAADPPAYRTAVDALVREMQASPFGRRAPATVLVQDAFPAGDDPGPRVFPLGAPGGEEALAGGAYAVNDVAYRFSTLRLEGVASGEGPGGGRRTVTVAVPIGAEFLEDVKRRFGQRVELLLYTLRGWPYGGTLSLAAERDPARAAERAAIVEEVDLGRNPVFREETIAGQSWSVAYDLLRSKERDQPMALVAVAMPRSEAIAAQGSFLNLFVTLAAVILVLELVVGTTLTRRLTDPLRAVARGARSVAAGRLDTRVRVEGGGEIGELADAFNRMTEELSRRIGELSKLEAASRELAGSLDYETVLAKTVEAFGRGVAEPAAVFVLFRHENEIEIAAGAKAGRRIPATRFPARPGVFQRALKAERAGRVAPPAPEEARDLAPEERQATAGVRSAVSIPFLPAGDDRGAVLILFDREEPDLVESDLEFLSTMARQAGIALTNARLYQLAIEDVVTGLFVHSHFLTRLREELDRSLAGDRALSVVLVALEEVEWVYESHGAEEGEHVLSRVVRRLRSSVRGLHLMARADRHTLEILLPETSRERALAAAREIKEEIARFPVRLRNDPRREVRFVPAVGIATCPDDAGSADFLMAEAHQALLRAIHDRRGGPAPTDGGGRRKRLTADLGGRTGRVVFHSEKMHELMETVDRIAASDVPILILGETGVGKEVVAELVHEKSRRRGKPLVTVNCAALPESLLEAELFGHEKGAFTGADRRKPGRFEQADGGTIFLDEIGEIPRETQVKLLRVLQDHKVERLGGTGPIGVDVRVIAATNADLAAEIRAGRFREDLYFRLNVVSLVIPPLRARKEEIPALVESFLRSTREGGGPPKRISPAAMDKLFAHSWPGNVRELRNTIERAVVVARGEEIGPDDVVFPAPAMLGPAGNGGPPAAEEDEVGNLRDESGLNPRQAKLIEYLARRETVATREYADLVGVSTRTGNRDIAELLEMGLIEQIGRKRAAVYRLKPRPA